MTYQQLLDQLENMTDAQLAMDVVIYDFTNGGTNPISAILEVKKDHTVPDGNNDVISWEPGQVVLM